MKHQVADQQYPDEGNAPAAYVEASLKVQLALLGLLVVSMALLFYLGGYIDRTLADVQLMAATHPELAFKVAGRLLLWLVVFSGSIAFAIGCYLWLLAKRTAEADIYPPPGTPVAFKVKIKTGKAAGKAAVTCRLAAILALLQPLLGLTIWYGITGGAW